MRYQVRKTHQWKDIAATYVGPTRANHEAWRFATPASSFPPRLSVGFHLAIRYSVNGKTYWDNNNGKDYRVGVGPRPIYPHIVLGGSNVVMDWLAADFNLRGNIVVKNLGYHKGVRIVYSTDNWHTVRELSARYFNSSWNVIDYGSAVNQENWGFAADLPQGAKQIKFAVRYDVQGQTYWDNHFRADYLMDVPGHLN